MPSLVDSLSDRACRMTDTYSTSIEIIRLLIYREITGNSYGSWSDIRSSLSR